MEPLKHPKALLCPFTVNSNSALQSLLEKPFSNFQGSHRASQASSQPSSQTDSSQTIEELNRKFRAVLAVFGDVGDSATFARELSVILEVSSGLGPNKRAYAKSLESALNEFLEAEEKGGLSKDMILEVVQEIQHAYECSFEISVDRKLLQEFLGTLQESQNAAARQSVCPAPARRARVMAESDEDVEDDEEDTEVEVPDVASQSTEAEDDAEEGLRQRWSDEHFLPTKRVQIAATLQPERQLIVRSMDKVFEKVRNKRGYIWSVVEGQIVDAPSDDSIQVRPVSEEKIIQDPILRKDIVHLAVKSKKCTGAHLYEGNSLVAMLRDIQRKEHRGMKCAYMGCGTFILPVDLVEDEEYNRFLARTAQEQEAEL